MRDFRQLKVWGKAHELVLAIYRATAGFLREELFGLTSQMRRSSASIPANIAEGCGMESDKAFGRYLRIAIGSACELEYQMLLARDLNLIKQQDHDAIGTTLIEVRKMLT